MKAKWIILIVVCLVAAMVCGLTLVACGDDEHVHSYTSEITTPATCGQPGVKTFTCQCGDTYTEAIEPTGEHTWNDGVESTPATCQQVGVITYTCQLCGQTKTENTELGNHSWDQGVVTEPTCVEDGETLYTCTVCGATNPEPIPCVGHHTWDEGVVTEPTCVEDGETLYTCTVCGATNPEPIPCVGHHTWDQGVETPATCGEDGETVYTCQACDETYSDPIPATGEHDWDEGEETTPATCRAKGVKTFTCNTCGQTRTEDIPTTPHDWDEGRVTAEPDCANTGSIKYTCQVCGKTRRETLPTTEHTLVEQSITEPTCEKAGFRRCYCTVCKQTVDVPIPATGHSLEFSRTVAPTCTEDGYDAYQCTVCFGTVKKNFVDKLGHDFDYSNIPEDDYFTMAFCKHNGCRVGERRTPNSYYWRRILKYSYTWEDQLRIDQLWRDMSAFLANADRYDEELHGYVKDSDLYNENKEFERNFYDVFMDEFYYVTEQYQYAFIDYCVYHDTQHMSAYSALANYRSDLVTNYYSLFRSIYDTKYREYFFSEEEGWTEEDIQTALEYSDTYGGGELAELNKRITEIENEHSQLDSSTISNDTGHKVSNLMYEYVQLKNQVAQLSGDYNHYMEYAYADVYGRDYTVDQTNAVHDFIKTNFGREHYNALSKAATWYAANAHNDKYLSAINGGESVFTSPLAVQCISAYFSQMVSDAGAKPINFYETVNELFKKGNYFQGADDRAFTWWIGKQSVPILYFGPGSYSDAFTFVHEFGHYYNDIYNGGASMSMDLNETHSQADELLFSCFLRDFLADKANQYTAEAIMCAKLLEGMRTILLATAVDEFEMIVYSGEYNGDNETIQAIVQDGITAAEYDALGDAIFDSYGVGDASYYWRYVTIDSPGYYISYAMSMISSMEFWAKAETDGLEAAKTAYFKLFTYTDEEENAYIDHDGDLVALLGYADVLVYCGMTSPFDEATYTTIGACIDALTAGATSSSGEDE